MKNGMFRKHGSWLMFEEVPGAGANGAGGDGKAAEPVVVEPPQDPPAGGEKPEGTVPLSRLNEVIGQRNDKERKLEEKDRQIEALSNNLSTVLARVDELAGQGRSQKEIADIVSEESQEWSSSKGFNEAVRAAVKGELKNLEKNFDGKIGSTLQMQARVILDTHKAKYPDFDESNPEVVKRIKAGYTLEDVQKIVYGTKTLGTPGAEVKPPVKLSPVHKPGPNDQNLNAPKPILSLRESLRQALAKHGK